MDICFAIHEAALLKHEVIQYFFYYNSATFQFCWIWCGKMAKNGPKMTKYRPKLAQNSQFSASNSAKLERNGGKIKQYLNCFKFQQSVENVCFSFVDFRAQNNHLLIVVCAVKWQQLRHSESWPKIWCSPDFLNNVASSINDIRCCVKQIIY